MQKLLLMALPLVVFCGIASAAVYQPCTNNSDVWTLTQLETIAGGATAAGCEIGDKIFTNFGGATQSATDTFSFFQQGQTQYVVNLSPGTEQFFSTASPGFVYNFSILVDETNAALVAAGKIGTISQLSAGIVDSNSGSSSTLAKVTTPNVGSPCTVNYSENGAVSSTGNVCNYSGDTSLNVTETFTYTGGTVTSGVSELQNTVNQVLTVTTGTPEPISLLLFGSGLLALSTIGRKRLVRK